jgi:hypothetical protein
LACPSWRWMTLSGTPSRASSSACAWRSWCGANRRRPPARAARRRSSLRTAAPDQGRPRVGPSMMQNSGPTGSPARSVSHGRRCSQPRSFHADLSALATLGVADEQRPAPGIEVVLGERQCFVDAQSAAPEHDDHGAQPPAVAVIGGVAHDRDDLLHRRRVGRVALPLVARRAPRVVAGHGGRRTTPAGGIEHYGHGRGSSSHETADRSAPSTTSAAQSASLSPGLPSVAS